MHFEDFLQSFQGLVESCPSEPLAPGSRYVVLSDLHMGDGGSGDDLAHNRAILRNALREWYFARGYTLVLSGDVEELHKFKLAAIRRAWAPLYAIFDDFAAAGRLRKIVGNHDLALLRTADYPYELVHGLSILYGARRIFCFHGHQASRFFVKYNYISDFIVRYLAKPLHVKNTSISKDSRQRFKAERRIYRASKRLGIVSIAGHTHRPLFESLSKYDSLRWAMESLLREYPDASSERRAEIADIIHIYRGEFERLKRKRRHGNDGRGLYEDSDYVIPCLFNSGCATGVGGFTVIELDGGSEASRGAAISLVHWAEEAGAKAYVQREALDRISPGNGPWARYTLRRDELESVFARIDLLGGNPDIEMMSRIAY
jgi:predicted phosphodiesterase